MRRRLRSNNSTILKLAMVGIVAMAGGFLLTSLMASKGETQALSATEFQPGRIIDDSIFYNPNTMTAAEIDAFIDSHNPACDMWGTQKVYGNVTRAEYVKQLRASGNTKYHDPPFVCISEYYENPETHKTNFSTGGKKEEGMLSAGEIIYKAAQEYSINPQVLLVMLKKESYVWGDDWPHNFQYNTVMGYACPDGAPCDTKYYGFYNQVMMAAWQLNYYRNHIYSYNYRPYTTNNILYNPDRSCGSKSVYLENIATTSLYIYTPYVPNDAALANYPGTSWCGSYGNRNFYMYFREWFGGTLDDDSERIDSFYHYLGGEKSYLGKEIDERVCNLKNNGCKQKYEVGYIYWTKNTGAWDVSGRIGDRWLAIGGEESILGYPTNTEGRNLVRGGAFQKFENGRIYYTPSTGAWDISGKIYTEWFNQGTEWSKLGYPTSSEFKPMPGIAYQTFENGEIFYKNGSAFTLNKWATDIFEETGGYSYLGAPISNENCTLVKNGCFQKFENGRLYWTEKTGAWEMLKGPIYESWFNQGTEWGDLGYPTSSAITLDSGVTYQEFENGKLYK